MSADFVICDNFAVYTVLQELILVLLDVLSLGLSNHWGTLSDYWV